MFFGPRHDGVGNDVVVAPRLTVDLSVAKNTPGTRGPSQPVGSLSQNGSRGVSLPRMQTSDRTRGVALLVPRLLSIQTDPAEFETADAIAEAIERSAEALLRWHDALADIQHRGVPSSGLPDPVLEEPPADGPAHASRRLAGQVYAGSIPADPAGLEVAASEMHRIAHSVTRVAATCPHESITLQGNEIAAALSRLSSALRTLADTLRTESRRLADGAAGGAEQVLGRVVRAEHAARLVAATTLRG